MAAHNQGFLEHVIHFDHNASLQVRTFLQEDMDLDIPDLLRCARDPSCLAAWTTALSLAGQSIMITDVLGYFNTTEGQACHFTLDEHQVWCHARHDALLTPGVGWL